VVVGSFDDIAERNAWIPCDTSKSPTPMQMRDIWGRCSFNFYYRRVEEWIKGKVSSVKGGAVSDGCYQLLSPDGKCLEVLETRGEVGSHLHIGAKTDSLNSRFMLYHLGNNIYRIISPNYGLALEESDEGDIHLWWNDEGDGQRWILMEKENSYIFVNLKSGKTLAVDENSKWTLKNVFGLEGR